MRFKLVESIDSTRKIVEAEVNIPIKHEGILEIPEDKTIRDLPISHFERLVKEKGYESIIRALNNLAVWNKNDDKDLSSTAKAIMDQLKEKYRKDEAFFKGSDLNYSPETKERMKLINLSIKDVAEAKDKNKNLSIDEIVDMYYDKAISKLAHKLGFELPKDKAKLTQYLDRNYPGMDIFSALMAKNKSIYWAKVNAAAHYLDLDIEDPISRKQIMQTYPGQALPDAILKYADDYIKEPAKEVPKAPAKQKSSEDDIFVEQVLTENADNDEQTPPAPAEGAESGITQMLNSLIKSEYDAIDEYNSAIVNCIAEGRQDIADVLTAISNDENTHVGNLLAALKLVNPQTNSIIDGQDEAEQLLYQQTIDNQQEKTLNVSK